MKPEIKQIWLEALPNYAQAEGQLKSVEGGFCCLGVLCDLAVKQGKGKWQDRGTFIDLPDEFGDGDWAGNYLTYNIQDWAGLEAINPVVPHYAGRDGQPVALSDLNDAGCTFAQIADLIKHFF